MENIKFSREEMHAELRMALYQTLRSIAFLSREKIALRLIGTTDKATHGQGANWLLSPESAPEDFDFDPKEWEIVETMDRLYDYAINGEARVPLHQMADETEYTFAAAYIYDFANAHLIDDINNGEGPNVQKCLHVAQLGAARVALDGGERYFHFGRPTSFTGLSIREVALLAGMEESSVRNASVKGKAGALKTFQDDGNTLVTCEDALEWLKGRKGFVPTSYRDKLGEIDLTVHSFASLHEIDDYMDARLKALGLKPENVARRMKTSHKAAKIFFGLYFAEEGSRDPLALERLANLLAVSTEVFVLRVQEAANQDEARKIRKALAELTAAKGPK